MSDPMPPADRASPREVLDRVLASPNGRALAAMYGPEFVGRTLPSLIGEVLAALAATGRGVPTDRMVAEIRERAVTTTDLTLLRAMVDGLAEAHTTLTAQVAALTAERES